MTDLIAPAPASARRAELERCFEQHRATLVAHCRRMLGSTFEADDAVQETMVRAWRHYHRFEGRASVLSWLHRIATNVCFDMMGARQRRPLPADPGSWALAGPAVDGPARPEQVQVAPAAGADPADAAVGREDVRLAFVAALLHLPPRQRAVLLLCEVLKWRAAEVAELLGTSVASVNSALQRARATLAALHTDDADRADNAASAAEPTLDPAQQALLHRCTEAFARYDIASLVALLT
jgi:RNA polymerase sigma-70 factor (ECF subfamily)